MAPTLNEGSNKNTKTIMPHSMTAKRYYIEQLSKLSMARVLSNKMLPRGIGLSDPFYRLGGEFHTLTTIKQK